MNWLIVAPFILAACFWVFLEKDWEVLGILAFLGGLLWIVAVIVATLTVWDFPPAMARMQETRRAVAQLPCKASFSASKVYGDAVDWNQEVASNRLWNGRWIADPFVADGWDTVTTIPLPSCLEP